MLLLAILTYTALVAAFLCWWAYGRGPVENNSRAIQFDKRANHTREDRRQLQRTAPGVSASFHGAPNA